MSQSSPSSKPTGPQSPGAKKEAWKKLKELASNPDTRLNPPAMDEILEDEYEQELIEACKAAVAAGVSKHKVFQQAQSVYEEIGEPLPSELSKLLLVNANPNRQDNTHGTVFHRLMKQEYPPDVHMPEERERDGSSLPELLQLATPNLADGQGDTVLHILLLRSGDGEYFPDDSTSGLMNSAPGTPPDNWAERAEYVEPAFRQLLEAGWSLDQPNRQGITPRQLLQVGLQACRNLVQHGEHSKMVSMAEGCSDEMGRAMAGIMGASMRGRRQMVTAFSIMQELAAAQRR